MRSLQWRLVSIFILIILSLMIVIWVFLNNEVELFQYNNFTSGIEKGFTNWDLKSMQDIKDVEYDLKKKDSNAAFYFSLANEFITWTIIDRNNPDLIVYSSNSLYKSSKQGEKEFLKQILKSNNLLTVLSPDGKKIGNSKKIISAGSDSFFDYARQLDILGGNYILYFRYDSGAWRSTIFDFNRKIIYSSIFAVVVALLIGFVLSKFITVPIVNMMFSAQKIAAGNFDQVLEVKSDDEVGKLTQTFNNMAKKLKSNLTEISREKNKIETILNYMTDGVLAFNVQGEVIHANPAAKKMMDVEVITEGFNELSKRYNVGITLEELLYMESLSGKERNVSGGDKFIRIYFALFTDENQKTEGIIAVLQDITEQQKLDAMRREYIANVSHELRTPLTSIKSYTETILDGVIEDKDTTLRFLGVVNSEADRMTRLVKDLLQLSKLDNQQMSWNMQRISFVDLVKSSIEKLIIEAKNKEQSLESYVIGEIPDVKADFDRIQQVVINVISNAIKYTEPNGKITVYIGKMFNEVYMKVVDTGVGIPEEDIGRIFERFYRVDKARSREMGGTGLGLSIAKEIVEAHGGSISAASKEGEGTEITVKLPVFTQLEDLQEDNESLL